MSRPDYHFHALEYRHCIAYAKVLTHIIHSLYDESFQDRNNISLGTTYFYIGDTFQSLRIVDNFEETRIGSIDTIDTHHLTFHKDCSTAMFDGNIENDLKYELSALNYTEEGFFQQSLIFNDSNNLFYSVVLNYLYMHCDYSFVLEGTLNDIIQALPELKTELSNTDYYWDFCEVMNMHYKFCVERKDHEITTYAY